MKRRIPLRRLEQERLAAQQARERRRRIVQMSRWAALFVFLGIIVAGVTYGLFFTPYTALRRMLPMPKRLISVAVLVNGAAKTVPAGGTLVVHPGDVVSVDEIHTDGKFNWGVRLHSEQFSAAQLLESPRQIRELWPDIKQMKPGKLVVRVVAGSQAIGHFQMEVRLRARDWVEKARQAETLAEKVGYYEKAAELASGNVLILTNLARLYGVQGEWAKAAATYEKVAASSGTALILKRLVEAYQKAGETDRALAAYLRLVRESRSDKEPFYGLISYLNAKKTPKQAASFLAHNLKAFPESYRPEVYAYLGTLYGQQGAWRRAIRAYRRALAGGVGDPVVWLNLGEAYSRIGDYPQAERSLRAYLQKKPADLDARLRLARVYWQRRKAKAAIRTLKGIIKDNPKALKAYLFLVNIYERLNRDREAAATYEAIARLAPANKVVYYNQGVLYFEMKQYHRAARAFARVLKLNPEDTDAREYLLQVYQRQNRPRQALAVLEELIKLRPSHWAYYAQAFELYERLKAYKEMVKTFSRAVAQEPKRPQLRSYLGQAYEKRGLLVEAIQQFEAATKLDPKDKDSLLHLASLYERIGKVNQALETYQKVLALDADNTLAQENYLRLKLKQIQSPPKSPLGPG